MNSGCNIASLKTTLYSAGSNSDGPLGLGHTDDVHQLSAACQPPVAGQHWQHVVTSGLHTLAVTNSWQLYAWGSNSHGQCGQAVTSDDAHTSNILLSPQLIALPTAASVKHIACGWRHTLIVTASNDVYVFGDNSSGQLGLSCNTHSVHTPTLLQLPLSDSADIVSISTGWQHSVCVSADGRVYAWGKNNKGQLGVAVDAAHKQPHFLLPTQIAAPSDVKFCKAVCGWQFTVLLSASRTELYATGGNQHGQLCVDSSTSKHSGGRLIRINLPLAQNEHVLDVKCGWSHCLCLTSQHRVFAFGRNDRGQCGVMSQDRHIVTTTIVQLSADCAAHVTRIACGSEHSLLATNDAVYGCGWNEHGNLGLATEDERVVIPTAMRLPTGGNTHITQLEAAGAVTMMLLQQDSG